MARKKQMDAQTDGFFVADEAPETEGTTMGNAPVFTLVRDAPPPVKARRNRIQSSPLVQQLDAMSFGDCLRVEYGDIKKLTSSIYAFGKRRGRKLTVRRIDATTFGIWYVGDRGNASDALDAEPAEGVHGTLYDDE